MHAQIGQTSWILFQYVFIYSSVHNERIFIGNPEGRRLLIKYAKEGLTRTEYDQLHVKLKKFQPSLVNLIESMYEDGFEKAPEMYQDFFLLLSSNSPVCGYLHYDEEIFRILSSNEQFKPSEMLLLKTETPVLAKFFEKIEWKISNLLWPVLKEVVTRAKNLFLREIHNIPLCTPDCSCRGHGFFPSLPVKAHRGAYSLDKEKKQHEGKCVKKSPRHPSLIPGLFTVSCIHGKHLCLAYLHPKNCHCDIHLFCFLPQ